MKKIKIALADDYKVFRESLVVTLSEEDMEVVIEAANGKELLKAMQAAVPDLVILDYKMPVMDGMATARKLRELYPSVKILVISMYDDDQFKDRLLSNGADSYLLKNAEPELIRQSVRELCRKK
jgi:DNA-binding NarL/FixJ family response regulator